MWDAGRRTINASSVGFDLCEICEVEQPFVRVLISPAVCGPRSMSTHITASSASLRLERFAHGDAGISSQRESLPLHSHARVIGVRRSSRLRSTARSSSVMTGRGSMSGCTRRPSALSDSG